MDMTLLNRGRMEYINLNKQFLSEVEKGASWEELQPLIDQMKSLAIYLKDIPTVSQHISEAMLPSDAAEAADVEEPVG